MATDTQEQLTKYLTDAHSIEAQALAQLRRAPDIAGDPELARILEQHLTETEEHERLIRNHLDQRSASPSTLKEIVMRAGGVGFLLFARLQPDTPGKLAAHAYSYEHLELAGYELLTIVARAAGETEIAETAQRIRGEEQAMAQRLEGSFDRAVDASLRDVSADDLQERLRKYLSDAHAIERQATALLERGPRIAGETSLAQLLEEHLHQTRQHARLVEDRLAAIGGSTNALKDAAMRLGALNWGLFFQAHPDTPGKLAAFAYAFEHLEIAGYEELKRVAQRAGDAETGALADRILGEERAAAAKLSGGFERTAEASLEAVGAAS
jgi:ferritin-like metal-binding protein YciE